MSIIVSTLSSRATTTTNPLDDWTRPRLVVSIIANDEWQERDERLPAGMGWIAHRVALWNQHFDNPVDDDTDDSVDTSEDSILPPLENSVDDEAEEADDDIPLAIIVD